MFCKRRTVDAPERIIISRTDKIGDLILSIPAFFMARKMYPKSEIAVLVREYNAGIVKNLPFIDRVWTIDGESIDSVIKKITDFKPDVFVALFSDKYTMKIVRCSGAPVRVGAFSKLMSWFSYNAGVFQKRSRSIKNEAEYNLDLVRSLNMERFDELFEIGGRITYTAANSSKADTFLATCKITDKFIIFHPFSGGSAKNFTLDEYVRLIAKTAEMLPNRAIVITSSTADVVDARKMKEGVRRENVFIYENGADILDLAALIDRAEVFVGASTGPSHIAGNLRKKAVCVYPAKATQSMTRWGLYGNTDVDYIVPDDGRSNEDYSKKTFDIVTDEIIERTALKIKDKFDSDVTMP